MSQHQFPLSAGVGPTERSGVGATPADAAAADAVPPDSMAGFPASSSPPPPASSSSFSSSSAAAAAVPVDPAADRSIDGQPTAAAPAVAADGDDDGDDLLIAVTEPPPSAQECLSASGATPVRLRGGGGGGGGGRRSRSSPRRLVSPQEAAAANRQLTAQQKLLVLDTWQRSGLPASDFGAIVGLSRNTLYTWKRRFEELGPAGLDDQAKKRLPTGSRLPELTKRTILMLKTANPEWGCQRISDVLCRGPGLPASANAVAHVLREAGYTVEELPTRPHPDRPRSFERAAPNQLWQSDLFTFVLKRQNRRLYLVAFMDDHSRYVVGYGLHASQSAALVLEVFRAAVASFGTPQEALTDNGAQYVTWRGTSAFARELQKRGVKHIVASPHRPQTLGKVERFWGTLWRECLEAAVFLDLEDARARVGHFIDYYNFQRPHQGLDGLTPADRFFGAAPQTLATLKARVQANALELARGGIPKTPFYLTGQVGGRPFSVHAEGERVFMVNDQGQRREIDLAPPAPPPQQMPTPLCPQAVMPAEAGDDAQPPAPGTSPLDQGLHDLAQALQQEQEEQEQQQQQPPPPPSLSPSPSPLSPPPLAPFAAPQSPPPPSAQGGES